MDVGIFNFVRLSIFIDSMNYFLSVCVFALSCFVSFAEEPLTADTLRKGGNTASEPLDMPHVVMDFPSAGSASASSWPFLPGSSPAPALTGSL